MFWCCGKNDINNKGCKYGKHESEEDEEDENLDKNEKEELIKLKLG